MSSKGKDRTMMARRLAVAMAALALLTASCGGGGGGDGDGATSKPPPAAGPAADGMRVYDGNCSSCHADDLSGRVGPALGPGSNAESLTDADLQRQIREGGNGMPGWDGLIPDQDIDAVIAYLRSTQRSG